MTRAEIPPLDPAEDFHEGALIAGRFKVERLLGIWRVGPIYGVKEGATPRLLVIARLERGALAAFLKRGRAISREAKQLGRLSPIAAGHLSGPRVYLLFDRPKAGPISPGPKPTRAVIGLGRALIAQLKGAPHPIALSRSLVFGEIVPEILDLGWGAGLDEPLKGAPQGVDPVVALAALLYAQITGVDLEDLAPGRLPTPPSWRIQGDDLLAHLDEPLLRALMDPSGPISPRLDRLDEALAGLEALDQLPPEARALIGLGDDPDAGREAPPDLDLYTLLRASEP